MCETLAVCLDSHAFKHMPQGIRLSLISEVCLHVVPDRRYTGAEGVYTHTVAYERDPACLECSPAAPLEVPPDATLQQVHRLPPLVPEMSGTPSVICGRESERAGMDTCSS